MRAILLASFLVIGCGDDGGNEIADAGPDAAIPVGTFSLTWEITVGGAPSSCAAAGIDEIELLQTPVGSGQGIADQWPCIDGMGTTFANDLGDYTLQVNALAADIAVVTGETFEETLIEGDVDLGNFVIDVNP